MNYRDRVREIDRQKERGNGTNERTDSRSVIDGLFSSLTKSA